MPTPYPAEFRSLLTNLALLPESGRPAKEFEPAGRGTGLGGSCQIIYNVGV